MRTNTKVADFMIHFENITCAQEGISLSEANNIIWEHKINALLIIDN